MADVEELKQKIASLEESLSKLSVPKTETKTVYISKDRKLQKFSGRPVKETDPSVEEWIEDVSYHINNITSPEAKIEFLYDHLQGQARDEIRTRPERERDSPAKILKILQDLFQDADSIAQIQQQFFQRDQKSGETLQQYSLVLLKLVDRMSKKGKKVIGDQELMLKERFIDGILDKQLRREMRRFALEHPDCSFQEFRTVVFKWVQDQKPCVSDVQHNLEQVELEQSAQKLDQPPELLKMLTAQQELLEAQQKQINLLTDLVQKSQVNNSSFRGRGAQSRGQFSNSRGGFRGNIPGFRGQGYRGRGTGSGRQQNNKFLCFNCKGEGHYARDCPNQTAQPVGNQITNDPLNL
ncbi:MAG: zinc finger domain-containing protein [Candidatus Thiodiazotropha endolucinida]|nr:zinc finger domain-containing protein [Candidatus Thiodiazotropha taylori]MCW4347299.1 zinc finger domain-containing protein [Candidatus Thiodiazotropha endolucinida]